MRSRGRDVKGLRAILQDYSEILINMQRRYQIADHHLLKYGLMMGAVKSLQSRRAELGIYLTLLEHVMAFHASALWLRSLYCRFRTLYTGL